LGAWGKRGPGRSHNGTPETKVLGSLQQLRADVHWVTGT
jgi:hypothetical protein